MSRLTFRRAPAALAVIALAAAGLHAASPAHAAPAEGVIMVNPDFNANTPTCSEPSAPASPQKDITDNGVTATSTYAAQGTSVADGNNADTTALKMASSVKARLTKIGGASSSFTGTITASASAVPKLASTVCQTTSELQSTAVAGFVLAKPMWVQVRATGTGDGVIQAFASSETIGAGTVISRGAGTASGYLPAGETQVVAGVQVRATSYDGVGARTTKESGSFAVVLRSMGYAYPASGAGLRYVALGSRKCSSDRVAVAFNSRVSKARAIAISVNGVRKMTFTGSSVRERVFSVPVKSSSKAKITATVVLDSGATVTAARSYLACS